MKDTIVSANGKETGTQYASMHRIRLKKLIHWFDLKDGDDSLVDKIVEQANQSDALTLLGLIPRVSPVKRQYYIKNQRLLSSADDVYEKGVITLNSEMLESWWNEIEWQI
jgi:hypothetical protein